MQTRTYSTVANNASIIASCPASCAAMGIIPGSDGLDSRVQ